MLGFPSVTQAQNTSPQTTKPSSTVKPNPFDAPPSVNLRPERIETTLTQGVQLIQEFTRDGHPQGPVMVTILIVNPKQEGVAIKASVGQERVWGTISSGREVVSQTALHHQAIAGINAGFFPNGGNPIGLHIQDGELVTEPTSNRTCFLLSREGKAQFAALGFTAQVKTADGKETFPVDGLNRRPAGADPTGNIRSELLVFTPLFADTTLKSPGRVEIILEGVEKPVAVGTPISGTVAEITEGGGTALKPGTVVLSGSQKAAEYLRQVAKPGTKLSFRFDLTTTDGKPFDGSEIAHAVAGGPRLISRGMVDIPYQAENMNLSFSRTRHPRTAVGVTKEGKILFVTVDGRQSGLSRGMSLTELAQLLQRYGAKEAVNLDGGGSSACVVDGLVVNSPSDGNERPVANMLLVFAPNTKKSITALPSPVLPSTALPTITVGQPWQLRAEEGTKRGVWGIKPGGKFAGFVRQDGLFYAIRPGTATLQYHPRNGKVQEFTVEVLPPPAPLPVPVQPR